MEFMYCIPDLEVFIDSTIKKCLLEYDLEREDTESVLNDIEKVMTRPIDGDSERLEKSQKDSKQNTHESLQVNRIKDLSSVLGAVQDNLQKLNATGKTKLGKEGVVASLVKDEKKMRNLPGAGLDLNKKSGSAQSEQNSEEDGGDSSRCPSRESKSSSPDISDSPKLPTKLKSRLQQRYFQNSREPSPELVKDTRDQKCRSPISPDSCHVTSSGFDCDRSLSSSPTSRNSRKRSASGDSDDDQAKGEGFPHSTVEKNGSLGQKDPDLEQPRAKIPHLNKHPRSPNSPSSHKPLNQTIKEADDSLFTLYCLAFRSSSDGTVPIENMNRSMHVPMLLKEKTDRPTSLSQNKQGQTESREKHLTATNARSLSSPVCSSSQPTQSHVAQSQKTNNHHERFQLLKQRLQQRNQKQNHQEVNSALLASQHPHHQQELQKRQQCMNGFHYEALAAAEMYSGHNTSLISSIIAEELMKVEDKVVPKSPPSSVGNKANSSTPRFCNGTSSSNLDVHTTDTQTMQNAIPRFTPPSQVPPLIAVASWHPPPPLIRQPLEASLQKVVPLKAHQSHVSASTVCVVPESSLCLKAFLSPPSDQYDENVPQDLSQKSSRRKVVED